MNQLVPFQRREISDNKSQKNDLRLNYENDAHLHNAAENVAQTYRLLGNAAVVPVVAKCKTIANEQKY